MTAARQRGGGGQADIAQTDDADLHARPTKSATLAAIRPPRLAVAIGKDGARPRRMIGRVVE